jgi:hypothetical protein
MNIRSFQSPDEFLSLMSPFLLQQEAQNSLILGILDTLIQRPETYPDFYLWAVFEDDKSPQ